MLFQHTKMSGNSPEDLLDVILFCTACIDVSSQSSAMLPAPKQPRLRVIRKELVVDALDHLGAERPTTGLSEIK